MPHRPRAQPHPENQLTRANAFRFGFLCLLAGTAWVLDAALPATLHGALNLLSESALLGLIFYLASGRKLPRPTLPILGYAALIIAIPGALASLADGRLSDTTIVLVYTLVPAATVFFAAQASQGDLLRLLGPALAGSAGAALILPFALPPSSAGRFWLAAIVISALAAGAAGLRLQTLLAGSSAFSIAALAAASLAIVAAPLYALQRPTLVLLTWQQAVFSEAVHLSLRTVTLLLSARLLRDLDPIAFSTRYLLIPLVTITEGYLLLHPAAAWTLPAGLLLLAGASALLLRNATQS